MSGPERIYRRKGTDEQEDELRRQQFHLATFCDDCIRTADTWPYTDKDPQGAKPKKLKVDDAYNAYREYCRLFNVTTPAEKVPFGRYIVEKYGEECQSINTSETVDKKKVDFRYYPNLYLVKSAERAFAEAKIPFNDTYDSNDTSTTDLRQIWDIENSICGNNTTNTTDKVLSRVINEIEAMFGFILSCKDEREITYESYLKTSVVSVVSVVNGQVIPVIPTTDEKNSVVEPKGSVVGEKPTSIEADLLRADEQEKAKNRHFGGVAAKLTRSKKGEPLNSNDLICHRLRQAVIRDFGMRDGGRIDPCLVAAEVRVPLDLVCRWLEKRGYVEIVENEEVYYRPSEYVGTEKLDSLKDLSDEDSATTSQLAIIDYIPGELDD